VLLDTGATASPELFPLRRVIDALMDRRLERHPRQGYHLLVLHTHSQNDHVAGDTQFLDRSDTTVVAADRETAWRFFGFTDDDCESIRLLDLGDRQLEVLATPGHDAAAMTFYDRWTGFLLTGDTV